MDEQLFALLGCDESAEDGPLDRVRIRVADELAGVVEVFRDENDPTPLRHTLKPLKDLYGTGNPGLPVDPESDTFGPLFLTIETTIVQNYKDDPSISDGTVALALDRLVMGPESDVNDDKLARRIQVDLRMSLSLNNYSRDEVRQALRRIRKSVHFHSQSGGRRGYLEFVREWIPV